jgi:hypothetical protein
VAGDDLSQILDLARREIDDVPDEVWQRFDSLIRRAFGTQRIYIAAHRKKQHLEQLQQAADDVDTQRIAQMLGVTPRRVRQLKKLR